MENLERIEKLFEQTATQMKKTDEKFQKLEIFIKETTQQMRELSLKTEFKLKEVGRQLGDIGHSMGDSAEEFFYNSLEENKVLGTVKFDFMSKNIKQKKHRQEDEYDIFMENGNSVGIIEVKQKVKQDHITTRQRERLARAQYKKG